MTIPVPLSVRLRTPLQDIHVADEIGDVQFGTTSPGGFDTCTITLHRPIAFTPGEVAQFGRLYVYDARNGHTVYEGRLQDPGRSAGEDGEVYQLAAVGGSAHLGDDTRQLYYIDTDPNSWDKIDNTTAASQVDQLSDTGATLSDDTPALVLRIPQGTEVSGAIPSRAVAAHRGISAAGQRIARVSFTWDSGLTSASLVASLYAATQGIALADVPWTSTFNLAGGSVARQVGTHWVSGRNKPIIRFHYTGAAGNVSADTWWLQITDLMVRCMTYYKDGSLNTGPYSFDTIYAHEVVEDILGRALTSTIDTENAVIDPTFFQIEDLKYPDGVSPAKLLDDLLLMEQAYTYHLWESNPDNDKFRFEWITWPKLVRFEADVVDGFSAPASGASVYNQVKVRWHNRGTIRVSTRTQSVPMLDKLDLTRTAAIDLGDEASTQANAHRVGDQFLAEHKYPTNAGRLTIRRPILDLKLGRMVQPWEIRAGSLIRVRGIEAYPDALNYDTGRDGITIFKVAATSYSASDAAATLELDTFAPSVSRALAALRRRPIARRR